MTEITTGDGRHVTMPPLRAGASGDPASGACIDEYDRLTGRTAPADIPSARWQQLAALMSGGS